MVDRDKFLIRFCAIFFIAQWITTFAVVEGEATILFRDTFEDTLSWEQSFTSNGLVEIFPEDIGNPYQTQAHGQNSLHIDDPDINSIANARHSVSIPDTANEYMIEFYFWIPVNFTDYSHFPLMVPWHIGTISSVPAYNTDISIFLEESGDSFEIQVQDNDSLYHNVAFLDTTNLWYKFQIHRKPNWLTFNLS